MSTASKTPKNKEIRSNWLRFTEVVRLFAEKKSERNAISEEEYQSLYGDLLKSLCDAAGGEQELYVAMKDLAEPWMNLGALQHADIPLLKDLVQRCHALDRQLTGKRLTTPAAGVSAAIVIGLFVVVFVIVFGTDVWTGLSDRLFDKGGTVAEWFEALERNRGQSRNWLLVVVAAVATAIGAWFVFRAPSSY